MSKPLVSVIVPTKNSALFLDACLQSVKDQRYGRVELIIVDGRSSDATLEICKKYRAIVYQYDPKTAPGTFDAPHRRNYGVKKSKGEYVYYVDADMELQPSVIAEAVKLCQAGAKAVIVPEDSFGESIWAQAKQLERRCYWGDDTIEAPRFFNKVTWNEVGGLDESLGGGGDDWDLYEKIKHKGYRTERTKSIVRHNEGRLLIKKLIKKRFMYGRDSAKYISKRPVAGFISYFPIRKAYLKNWRLFASRPFDTAVFIVMRTAEYVAGFTGILYTTISRRKSKA
jgi:glycosyltransferase involved in cell wall biosynthesis